MGKRKVFSVAELVFVLEIDKMLVWQVTGSQMPGMLCLNAKKFLRNSLLVAWSDTRVVLRKSRMGILT